MHPETILREVEIDNSPVALAIVKFGDQTMVTVSDNGTFGAFHDIEIAEMRPGTDPVITIKPIFGYSDDYTKVGANLYSTDLKHSGGLSESGDRT